MNYIGLVRQLTPPDGMGSIRIHHELYESRRDAAQAAAQVLIEAAKTYKEDLELLSNPDEGYLSLQVGEVVYERVVLYDYHVIAKKAPRIVRLNS